MKSSHKFWLTLIGVPLGITAITVGGGYLSYRPHPEPFDTANMTLAEKVLNEEADRIELPQGAEILDRRSLGKQFSVLVVREFRTTIQVEEVRRHIFDQMVKNGWTYVGVGESGDAFCKEKYYAGFARQNRGIWQDGNFHYNLTLTAGDRGSIHFGKSLPKECIDERINISF